MKLAIAALLLSAGFSVVTTVSASGKASNADGVRLIESDDAIVLILDKPKKFSDVVRGLTKSDAACNDCMGAANEEYNYCYISAVYDCELHHGGTPRGCEYRFQDCADLLNSRVAECEEHFCP